MATETLDTEIKELLMSNDEEFKRLFQQHHTYDEKLDQLSTRHFLTESEQLEEVTLKKKKLMLKDQMHAIIVRHRKERALANHP